MTSVLITTTKIHGQLHAHVAIYHLSLQSSKCIMDLFLSMLLIQFNFSVPIANIVNSHDSADSIMKLCTGKHQFLFIKGHLILKPSISSKLKSSPNKDKNCPLI